MAEIERLPHPGPRPIGAVTQNIIAAALGVRHIPRVFCDLVAAQIRRSLLEGDKIKEAAGLQVDQHQSNGLYGVHQLRVTLPEGMGTYRVIIAAPNVPVLIGTVPADQHFLEPLVPTPPEAA